MLEIKTIYQDAEYSNIFDRMVNEALEEGWELVRREIVTPSSGNTRLYAELERYTEEEEDQMQLDDTTAEWVEVGTPPLLTAVVAVEHPLLHPLPCAPLAGE